MKTIRIPALLLGLLYLCFFGSLALSNSRLPTRMATHFGATGQPNGWMSRSAYLWFMIVFGVIFPLFVPALCYLSRWLPSWCYNIPHRDYWLAPERWRGVSAYLFRHSLWFAAMALAFVMGIHFSTVQANSFGRAHLSLLMVLALAMCFLVGTVIWAASMFRHFNRVAEPAPTAHNRAKVRRFFLAAALGLTLLLCWFSLPDDPGMNPYALSRVDGKVRFYRTRYNEAPGMPPNFPVRDRLFLALVRFKRHYIKPNPAAYFFPPQQERPWSVVGMLDECMEVSGKQYLVAVEIRGEVDFGHNQALNGSQFVAAFEHALETSDPVSCYDYGEKRAFEDKLLLIREGPRLVKVVPRSKLGEYQKAGLVKRFSPSGEKA